MPERVTHGIPVETAHGTEWKNPYGPVVTHGIPEGPGDDTALWDYWRKNPYGPVSQSPSRLISNVADTPAESPEMLSEITKNAEAHQDYPKENYMSDILGTGGEIAGGLLGGSIGAIAGSTLGKMGGQLFGGAPAGPGKTIESGTVGGTSNDAATLGGAIAGAESLQKLAQRGIRASRAADGMGRNF